MSAETIEEYQRLTRGIHEGGVAAYAVAIVMADGRLVRGGDFGTVEHSERLAQSLRESLSNLKAYQRSSAAS